MEPFIGEIRLFAGNYVPVGWHMCDGSLMQVSGNEALFSLIGTTYGGNGATTFGLPDLRGRVPVGQGHGTNLTNRVVGQTGGASAVQLTVGQTPSHTHTVAASSQQASQANMTAGAGFAAMVPVASPAKIGRYVPPASGTPVNLDPLTISIAAGGGQPHSNLMPYMALNYIIAIEGIYPTRP